MPLVFSIQEKHAVFSNHQRRVSVTPVSGSKVIVNGTSVSKNTDLQHLVWIWNSLYWRCSLWFGLILICLFKDRLVLGSNSTYLYIGFPSERSGEDWSRYDYDYFQSELAAAEGIHIQSLCDDQGHRMCVCAFNLKIPLKLSGMHFLSKQDVEVENI